MLDINQDPYAQISAALVMIMVVAAFFILINSGGSDE